MGGHRAPIIAFMGFLALFIIHWAASPGAAERPPLPESRAGRAENTVSGSCTVLQYGHTCPGMDQDAGRSTAMPFSTGAPAVGNNPGGNDDALPGGATLQNRAQDALSEGTVLTGKKDDRGRQTRALSPGSMTAAQVREAEPANGRLLASGRLPATGKACPAGAMPPVEIGFASMDPGLD